MRSPYIYIATSHANPLFLVCHVWEGVCYDMGRMKGYIPGGTFWPLPEREAFIFPTDDAPQLIEDSNYIISKLPISLEA